MKKKHSIFRLSRRIVLASRKAAQRRLEEIQQRLSALHQLPTVAISVHRLRNDRFMAARRTSLSLSLCVCVASYCWPVAVLMLGDEAPQEERTAGAHPVKSIAQYPSLNDRMRKSVKSNIKQSEKFITCAYSQRSLDAAIGKKMVDLFRITCFSWHVKSESGSALGPTKGNDWLPQLAMLVRAIHCPLQMTTAFNARCNNSIKSVKRCGESRWATGTGTWCRFLTWSWPSSFSPRSSRRIESLWSWRRRPRSRPRRTPGPAVDSNRSTCRTDALRPRSARKGSPRWSRRTRPLWNQFLFYYAGQISFKMWSISLRWNEGFVHWNHQFYWFFIDFLVIKMLWEITRFKKRIIPFDCSFSKFWMCPSG